MPRSHLRGNGAAVFEFHDGDGRFDEFAGMIVEWDGGGAGYRAEDEQER